MIAETNTVNFRRNVEEFLSKVQYRHDSVVINQDGKPVAALIDIKLFEQIHRMREHFDVLSQNIAAGYVDVSAADAIADIEAAIAAYCGSLSCIDFSVKVQRTKLPHRARHACLTSSRRRRTVVNIAHKRIHRP